MTERMEKIIDSYHEGSIELADQKLLCFKRISDYKRTDRRAVKISVEDLETETTIELATYFDAKWPFSSPMSESIFWKYAKEHHVKFKEVFDRLRETVPSSKEIHAARLRFSKLSDNTSSQVDKLSTIFKGDSNGQNV